MAPKVIAQQKRAITQALKDVSGTPNHPLHNIDPDQLIGPRVFSNVHVFQPYGRLLMQISGYVQIGFICDQPLETQYWLYFFAPSDNSGTPMVSPYFDNTVGVAQIYPQQYTIPSAIDHGQPAYGYALGNTTFFLVQTKWTMLVIYDMTLWGYESVMMGVGWQVTAGLSPTPYFSQEVGQVPPLPQRPAVPRLPGERPL